MIDKDLLKQYADAIGVPLDSAALERFDTYAALLVEWNRKMNLTAITAPEEIVIKHFIDSLVLLPFTEPAEGARVIDVGTGAGFPGIPLLIARNDIRLTLADALNKRLVFLEEVLAACGLHAATVHARAEELGNDERFRETYDLAVARAVAPLNVLSEYCLPFVKVGGSFLAMKGTQEDMASAERAVKALGGEIERTVSYELPNGDGRSMILIKKISQTSTRYPRKSKKIASAPL